MMRTLLAAALCLPLITAPAWAQSSVGGQILDIEAKILDIVATVNDLDGFVRPVAATTSDLQVKETDTEIHIELAADILFAFDSADIQPKAAEALKQVAALIRERSAEGLVRVEGHTDSKGRAAYNQGLSERRAESVKIWLVSQEGLPASGITTHGFGLNRPVAPNAKPDGSDDPEGRQRNRRVEIVVQK